MRVADLGRRRSTTTASSPRTARVRPSPTTGAVHDRRAREARARRGHGVAEPTGRRALQAPGRALAPAASGSAPSCPWAPRSTPAAESFALTTAAGDGAKQTGTFGGGVVQGAPAARARGAGWTSYLRGGNFRACRRAAAHRSDARGSVLAGASRHRRVRRLWGSDSGGPLPHARPPQPRHRSRHALAHRGPLRRHAHPRHGGRRRRPRPRAPAQGARPGRPLLPRTQARTRARNRR